ncbi:MAG: Fur family transcriptional regulator [Candidatus Diapherotrites archaeon]|nr:Fur family transcriptional regulator [Candidatus Diapherotrites archaeon]
MNRARNTVQLQKIREYLSGVKSHPNAETVFNAVKKGIPSVTLATVYRNLNKLADSGEILRLEVNGEYRFDADKSMHQHAVCTECGGILDFMDVKLGEEMLKKFKSKEFMAEKVKIFYEGKCRKCSSKK